MNRITISLIALLFFTASKSHGASCCSESHGGEQKTCTHEHSRNKGYENNHSNILCPVSGKPADKKLFIDSAAEGKESERTYFCCSDCMETYKKDPDQYRNKDKQNPDTTEKIFQKSQNKDQKTEIREYEVFGMDCPGCHGGLAKLIEKIPGVVEAKPNWKKKHVIIHLKKDSKVKDGKIHKAIRDANFTPGKRLQ